MKDFYQTSIFDGTEQSTFNQSIELIRGMESIALARHPVGYVVGYSGGKDSDVLVDLFRKAGVKFMVMHNHTTLDAPETVRYIRKKFAEFERGGGTLQNLLPAYKFLGIMPQETYVAVAHYAVLLLRIEGERNTRIALRLPVVWRP